MRTQTYKAARQQTRSGFRMQERRDAHLFRDKRFLHPSNLSQFNSKAEYGTRDDVYYEKIILEELKGGDSK